MLLISHMQAYFIIIAVGYLFTGSPIAKMSETNAQTSPQHMLWDI